MRALLLASSLLLVACPAGPSGTPTVDVTPGALDFGSLEVGDWEILEFAVTNAGSANLDITAATVGDPEGPFTSGGAAASLRPGEGATISVSFRPLAPGAYSDTLHFETNSVLTPSFDLPLTGTALAPALQIAPEAVDFGERPDGCGTTATVSLSNTGDAALVGLELRVTGDDDGLQVSGLSGPFDLAPAEVLGLTLSWAPPGAATLDAQLEVRQGNEVLGSVGVTGQGTAIVSTEATTIVVPEVTEVDLLWVVDTGLSMSTVQSRLGNGAFELMDELEDQFFDWRFAVISADASRDGALLAPVIEPTTPDRGAAFTAAVTQSGGSVSPGFGMEMAWAALNAPNTDSGGPNEGILRPGAGLAIIFVSTGVDQSTMLGGSGAAFRDAFIGLKADPAMLSISLVTGGEDGCQVGTVAASSTPEYLAAAWRGQIQSVCTNPLPLWPMTYSGPHQRSAFPLSPPALPASIEVTLTPDEGEPTISGDWSYDTDNDWLVFPDGDLPPADATLSVTWAPADVCPD
jgi:hypothetical protein